MTSCASGAAHRLTGKERRGKIGEKLLHAPRASGRTARGQQQDALVLGVRKDSASPLACIYCAQDLLETTGTDRAEGGEPLLTSSVPRLFSLITVPLWPQVQANEQPDEGVRDRDAGAGRGLRLRPAVCGAHRRPRAIKHCSVSVQFRQEYT